jgi:3-mercaptopyruvate sulfurtransferase SseA
VNVLFQAAAVVAAGTLVGLGANAASPRAVPLGTPVHAAAESGAGQCSDPGAAAAPASPRIGAAEAKGLCDACTAGFVDARSASEYAAGHVTNAIHLPPAGHPGERAAVDALRAYPLVVVYDGDYSCALADDVAARLRRAGLRDVRVLEGAWPAWVAAGGSGASGYCPECHAHPHAPEVR